MRRLAPALAAAALAVAAACPALAADFDDLRGSFNSSDWASGDDGGALNFELGLRYFYSKGSDSFSVGPTTISEDDTTHILEAHFRITDPASGYFVQGLAGYSMAIEGTADSPTFTGPITRGHVGYMGGDIGYEPFGDPAGDLRLGFLAGYQYWDDSPDLGRANFTTGTSSADFSYDPATGAIIPPGDSKPDAISLHALRLGVTGDARLGPMVDLSAELAAVPYARVNGTLGAFSVAPSSYGSTTTMQASAADLSGWGYGAMAQAMIGFHPTDNMTIRLGGRAWYLRGWADTTFNTVTVTNPTDADHDGVYDTGPTVASSQHYISTGNPFELFRYGALAELTYNF